MGGPTADRSPAVLAVTAAMISCSTVFVFFRLVSRIGIVKRVMLDDYFILLAWVISFGLSFAICDGTQYGLGKHETDIPASQRDNLNRLDYVFTVLYNPALMATKTSILVFYLGLSQQQRVFTWTIWVTLLVVDAAGLALSLVNIFQCRPMSVLFDDIRPPGTHCTDIVTLYLSSAPVNIITDIAILLLPMPVLKGMHLPQKQKWILYITFGFGIFVAVVDVVRVSYLQNAAVTRATEILDGQGGGERQQEQNSDFSWIASFSFMWSAVEVNVGIMVACVPALKPLVSRFVPQLIRDKVKSKTISRASQATMDTEEMVAAQRVPSVITTPQNNNEMALGADEDTPCEIGINEFLTTPDMDDIPRAVQRTQTAMTNTTTLSRQATATNFDFMTMADSKGIVYMTNRESIRPIVEVTVLFFLWGFAYGLLNALNGRIQVVTRESADQAVGTHSAYFLGYFFAPLTFGRWILKHWGFKACYMIGLMVYGIGTLIFWPAAVLASWPGFLVSNFIIGLGLSTLELAANPFIALCGPPEYGEMRLNLSQGFQACGTVFANVLAKKALFQKVLDAPSLIDVQWTYLAISLFTFVLAFVYYVLKVPEVTDDELEDAAEQNFEDLQDLRKKGWMWITLGVAVLSQFCYVGAQESVATSLDAYIQYVSPGADYVNYEAVGQTLFAVSRFLAAFMGFFLAPRLQLILFYIGAIVFSALSMNFTGLTAGAMVMCVFFFEGPLFSLIYVMPLRIMGKYTKDASVLLAASISGGSFFPAMSHVASVARGGPGGVQYSFCVAVAAFAFGAVFPLYVNSSPKVRQQVDPSRKPKDLRERPRSVLSTYFGDKESEKRRSDPSSTEKNSTGRTSETNSEDPAQVAPGTPIALDFGAAHIRHHKRGNASAEDQRH